MSANDVWIAEAGEDEWGHRFGGTRWTFALPEGSAPAPMLLMTLDLADPRLAWSGARPLPLAELPLALHVDDTLARQRYVIEEPAARRARFAGPPWSHETYVEPDESAVERRLRLRAARGAELGARDAVIDTLLGGSGFLRIGGAPVWVQDAEEVRCECGGAVDLAASIGYQSLGARDGLLASDGPLFLGELVAHFFVCWPCRAVTVVSEST
jgi:hypothetical protein